MSSSHPSQGIAWTWFGLGSNQGDRVAHLAGAIRALRQWPELSRLACSQVYRTAYVGPGQQEDYWNLCCRATVSLDAPEVLRRLLDLEAGAGRRERTHMRPRPLDIDLLMHRDESSDEPDLALPHPRLHLRRFVLEPLADLDPSLRVGPAARAVSELLRAPEIESQRVTALGRAEDVLELQEEPQP